MKRNIYFAPDSPPAGGAAPQASAPTVESLLAENKSLKDKIIVLEAAQAKNAELEGKIAEKTKHGLSREQAIAVIKRQEEHDTAKEAAKKAPKAPAKK